jgi:hypothetical protein
MLSVIQQNKEITFNDAVNVKIKNEYKYYKVKQILQQELKMIQAIQRYQIELKMVLQR